MIQLSNMNIDTQGLINIVKECNNVLLKYRNTNISKDIKSDGSEVTKADIEVNEILQDYLKDKYPEYGIVSEELDKEWKEYTWHIDPLNGTKAYLNGKDSFNILIGLVYKNKPIFGLISHPVYNKIYIGDINEKPRVIQENNEIPIIKSKYKEENLLFTPSENWENVFTELFKNSLGYRFVHTDELGNEFKDPRIHIIEGGINLQINSNFGAWGTWDICAGHAILSSMSGIMTDYYGNDIDYSKPMLDNGFIASDTLERINKLNWVRN